MSRLSAGDPAPRFVLPDQDGTPVALPDAALGRLVLFFYPAAGTPGCTAEACDFRDSLAALRAAGLAVVGVSRDGGERLRAFRAAEGLRFPLLSDPDHSVHEAYGAWGERTLYGRTSTGPLRSTFVIGADGRIEHAAVKVRAAGHVARLRRTLGIDG